MSKFFYKDTPLIGLDISSSGIKVMSVDSKKWLVNGYGSIDVDPKKMREAIEDSSSTFLADTIVDLMQNKLIGTITGTRVAVAVPTAKSYTRTFTLPASAEKSLDEAVSLEAEQYIPIPISTLYIDYQIIERKNKTITVLMSAMSRTIIDNITKNIEAAKLFPTLIEPSINSVGRVLTATEDGTLPTVIVDIGPTSTDIAILDKGSIRVTGGIPIGGNTFTLDVAKKMNVSLENAHQLKVLNGLSAGPRQQRLRTALSPSLDAIITETRKVMRYYTERIDTERKLEQLLIVGSGSNVPGIGDYFTENIVIAARVASPWQKLDFGTIEEPQKQLRPRFITVAGAASVVPGAIWK
ncbi:type IV pilus assembly protein PilM [Candidatus Saccharibacteria bacterium TM7i]|nr:type IV pilus assembly protein PilM [Candidatus Saccharibacteria bacterium TM7i]